MLGDLRADDICARISTGRAVEGRPDCSLAAREVTGRIARGTSNARFSRQSRALIFAASGSASPKRRALDQSTLMARATPEP
jgi:hypothetical protein